MEEFRPWLNAAAAHADEYAGMPMPINGQPMVIHPSYKFAPILSAKPKTQRPERHGDRVRNSWHSVVTGFDVVIMEDKDGRAFGGKLPPAQSRAGMQLATMGCASAWDFKAELVAQEKLRSLIKPHLFEMYQMTGAFIETSAHSQITYMFRRLRPTLALTARKGNEMSVLCGLCLHPIGYYQGTWGGCMVPTDEVVAHLMLMRGDEADFWRQANQHPAWHPSSGL